MKLKLTKKHEYAFKWPIKSGINYKLKYEEMQYTNVKNKIFKL